ncbi:GntR family transcriptional regulator [Kouleothrix sp.]|uniref:GntR family transcriptional regulator n=1 Tax=Kouleothrix sp. TaxID=2779161 RepID=UPI00391A3520
MALRTPVRGASLVEQTVAILLERINSGVYARAAQLPPEHMLAAEFNVSRATIRSAIGVLAERGMVLRRHGVGTFVSQIPRLANPLNEAEDFSYMIARGGCAPGVRFVQVELAPPEPAVAAALALLPGQRALRSCKVFTADGEPVIFCVNTVPEHVLGEPLAAEALREPQLIEPLFDMLERRCGRRTQHQLAKIRAARARECRFPELALAPDTPLLFIEEVGFTADEAPIWHSYEYFPNSFMTFELVRERVRR